MSTELDRVKKENQRLRDLVRYCRHQLFEENLITENEYSWLVQTKGAVQRLESYDEVRARLKEKDEETTKLRTQLDSVLERCV